MNGISRTWKRGRDNYDSLKQLEEQMRKPEELMEAAIDRKVMEKIERQRL